MRGALAELPDKQRRCVLLRIDAELSFREIGAAVGCSEGSVKTHYSRAVHTLRDALGEHWQ